MAITDKNGRPLVGAKTNTKMVNMNASKHVTLLEFTNLINSVEVPNFVCRPNNILLKETLSVNAGALKLANLHLRGGDLQEAMQGLGAIRTYEIAQVGTAEELQDLKVGDIPQLDFENSMALKHILLNGTNKHLMNIAYKFGNLSEADKTIVIGKKKPIVATEYLIAQNHAIIGKYSK